MYVLINNLAYQIVEIYFVDVTLFLCFEFLAIKSCPIGYRFFIIQYMYLIKTITIMTNRAVSLVEFQILTSKISFDLCMKIRKMTSVFANRWSDGK